MPSERTGDPPKRPSLAAAAAAAIAAVCFGVYSCPPASLLRVFAEPSCSDAEPWPCEEEGCPRPRSGAPISPSSESVARPSLTSTLRRPRTRQVVQRSRIKGNEARPATWPGRPAGPAAVVRTVGRPGACSGAERACAYRLALFAAQVSPWSRSALARVAVARRPREEGGQPPAWRLRWARRRLSSRGRSAPSRPHAIGCGRPARAALLAAAAARPRRHTS